MKGWKVDFYDLFWYLSIFVAVQCVCWYKWINALAKAIGIDRYTQRLFTRFSNLSFGIYLIHIFIMRYLLWQMTFIRAIDSYILQTGVVVLLTFVGSALVCYLISLLPGAQYMIGIKSNKS